MVVGGISGFGHPSQLIGKRRQKKCLLCCDIVRIKLLPFDLFFVLQFSKCTCISLHAICASTYLQARQAQCSRGEANQNIFTTNVMRNDLVTLHHPF